MEHVTSAFDTRPRSGESIDAWVTHYGESFNGSTLGCGTGSYSSDDPTIVAVSPEIHGQVPCGTLLEVCGPGGCQVAARKDACPGCSRNVFDLSEAAFSQVCGTPTGVCEATVHVLERCALMPQSLSLARPNGTGFLHPEDALAIDYAAEVEERLKAQVSQDCEP